MTSKKIERSEHPTGGARSVHRAQDSYEGSAAGRLFAGGGEVGALLAKIDWARTPLGPVERWPQALRTSLRICLTSRHDIILWWGADLRVFYNDAYTPTLGIHHPAALGQPGSIVWAEIWDVIGPMLEGVLRTGQPTWSYDQLLYLERNGYPEETYHTYSYSPIEDDSGEVGGVFTAVTETTLRVLAERRAVAARDLAAAVVDARTTQEVCARAMRALAADSNDVPFALLYLREHDRQHAHLAASTGLALGVASAPFAPATVDLAATSRAAKGADAACVWPIAQVARTHQHEVVADLPGWPGTPLERRGLPPRAVVLPITEPGQPAPSAFLVAGVNAHRALDDDYLRFYELLASHLASSLASAHAYEEERKRAEALEEIDRAKTVFFSNVSHEFRTPLTLMLGPLEDLLAANHLAPDAASQVRMIHRNGLRLLKLVNTLLDFARIEAGRTQAVYVPTDLAALTTDLASTFRSVIERAELRLVVDCPPLADPVYVDRDMWEKIVLNLLSNAFKFTFDGEIVVSLTSTDSLGAQGDAPGVELRVRDTGTGIPPAEMPRLFERFHRVRDAASRTHEGSGIGLALVRDLVQLHGGTIRAESQLGGGTTFIVTMPLGRGHLPAERIESGRAAVSTALGAAPFVEEARRWLPGDNQDTAENDAMGWLDDEVLPTTLVRGAGAPPAGRPAHILLADDNSDLRAYVRRLLGERYTVEAVSNGAEALAAARERPPDLVLSDVMMPELDGFGLLRALRDDPRTRDIPIILLSARAGEEATIEGLEAGADDYLIKPFSAREVLARVTARLEIARLRGETLDRARQLEAIFATMADALVLYDETGNMRQWNAATAALFEFDKIPGYTDLPVGERPAHLRVRDPHDRPMPAADLPFMRAVHGEVLTGADAVDLTFTTPAGKDKHISVSAAPLRDAVGRVTGAVTVYRDVTERYMMERRTSDSLTALMAMAETLVASPAKAGTHDSGEAREQSVRRVLTLIQGIFAGQFTGAALLDFATDTIDPLAVVGLAPDATARWWDDLRENSLSAYFPPPVLKGVRAEQIMEVDVGARPAVPGQNYFGIQNVLCVTQRLRDDHFVIIAVEVRDHPTFTPQERDLIQAAVRLVALVIERDRLARERTETVARNLALTETNRRMSEFLSIASHELRTPLTSMSIHVQVAERGLRALLAEDGHVLPGGVEARLRRTHDMLERTERQMKRLERLIADLLDVSRIAAGRLEMRPTRGDLRDMVREAVEEQQAAWPGRAITLDLPRRGPLAVEVDGDRIAQVVTNYLTNALKYSDGDQSVAVSVRVRGARARVAVRDHGPGLSPAQKEHLWEEFYRVPDIASRSGSGVGLGLGLYICRTIIGRHGGEVGLDTTPGDGSTFWFTLPLAHDGLGELAHDERP